MYFLTQLYHEFVRMAYPWKKILGLTFMAGIVVSMSLPTEANAGACTELLTDGGLESGAGWVAKSNNNHALFSDSLARTGHQAAYLAGTNNSADKLATLLKVPQGPDSVTVSFWWQIQSQDVKAQGDALAVLVADGKGQIQQKLDELDNRDLADHWQQRTYDLSHFAGQSIQLQFLASTDADQATDFFIDDVEVLACRMNE
ncbi:MAG: choice-of-anchor J domain-containing protein [Caldilineaceae bacterium]